jgi:hypothetical protein
MSGWVEAFIVVAAIAIVLQMAEEFSGAFHSAFDRPAGPHRSNPHSR